MHLVGGARSREIVDVQRGAIETQRTGGVADACLYMEGGGCMHLVGGGPNGAAESPMRAYIWKGADACT